jgi:hypothetical protein
LRFLIPTLLLIGVVIIISGAGRRGVRTGRSIFLVLGVMLFLAVVLAFIVNRGA